MERFGRERAGRRAEGNGADLLGDWIGELLLAVQQLSDRVGALEARESGIAGLRPQIDGIERIIKEILMGGTADMETRMDLAEQAVWSAFDEVERLNHEVEWMEEEINNKARIAGLQSLIQALEMKIAEQDARLAQQAIRLKILEDTSYNGELLWKISGMAQKRHDAIIGKITAIDSVYFFTSRTGYKMRAQVYLNGYGRGEDTHISVFFVMMKGEYDAILPWPFRQKVTFALLDQERQEDVTDSFHAGAYPTSPSFARPGGEENLPCGTPDFVPLEQVYNSGRAYVRDDTMFLKITVGTAGLI
ncbi:PREDICTED: TNF receptor-associated factor 1-like [Branchiostoma belcheri]|uniref:TNF receptor-associated factor 1-like n=1 Tax=Branchiostoma belcheri TaxID=7741 RepID=A0A6P4Y3F3_BRABE|nr:PREDICTED: TNF receptor-associated factor 1-like [Branchiostoma belcheri]